MAILSLNNVSYQYPGSDRFVLTQINARFEKGKVYGIMGSSGAGKSTLLSLLSGLDIATNGTIHCHDQDLSQINRDNYRAQNVGLVFQNNNLLLNATALENIILSMQISGCKQLDKNQFAHMLLARIGIDKETAHRKVLKLSGGEQQRVGIARALAHQPEIIIADEPTGNLDSDTEENIMDMFTSLAHQEDKCVIIATHSKKAATHCNTLWGMTNGHLNFVR